MQTERLVLRPFMRHDAVRLEAMGNDPEVLSRISRSEVPQPGTGEFWMENRYAWWEKGEAADFVITLGETGESAGIISLGMEYPGDESMRLSFWLGKDYWNNGYATEAAMAMLPFGFDNLNLHRIYARYFASNPTAGRVLEKLYMSHEGTLREAAKQNGIFEDLVCYGILRHEFNKSE